MQNNQHLTEGTLLKNKYEIRHVLGEGGFSVTYLGWDKVLEIAVAIKQFVPKNSAGMVTKERFLKEARQAARLSADIAEIAQVRDYFEENEEAFIVMEYVDGITLSDCIKSQHGRMLWDEVAPLFQKVVIALQRVHDSGIIHRDISPENIMLLADGGVKILDFGAVKDVGVDVCVGQEQERTTTAIVKPGFAPIEQYQSRGNLGPWTDVYGVCATIFFCLTAENPPEAPERALNYDSLSFAAYGASIPDCVEKALVDGLEIRVENRISNMGELYQRLFLPGQQVISEKMVSQKSGRPHRNLRIAMGLFAIIVVAVGLVFLDRFLPRVVPEENTEQNLQDGTFLLSAFDNLEEVLANPDVQTVIIPEGVQVLCGKLSLNKRVVVEQGAKLEVGYLNVEDSGHVQVEGTLDVQNSLLYLQGDDACITLAQTGTLLESKNLFVYMEKNDNLVRTNYAEHYSAGKYMVLDMEDMFSEAVAVNSYEELVRTAQSGTPARIESDIHIPEECWLSIPVWITETASVTVESGVWFGQSGGVCVNQGEFVGSMNLDQGAFLINWGRIEIPPNEDSISLCESADSNLINMGELELNTCSRVWKDAFLYNVGRLLAYDWYLMGGSGFNFGDICAKEQCTALTVTNGGELYNYGSFVTEEECYIRNGGWIENAGRFVIEDNCQFDNNIFYNRSLFESGFTATLNENSGIYFGNGEFVMNGITGVAVWKTVALEQYPDFCEVASAEELTLALENNEISGILVKNPIQMENDLEITKPVFFCADFSMSETAVCTLKNTYAVLMEQAEVSMNYLELQNSLWIEKNGFMDLSNSCLTLENGSAMAFWASDLAISDSTVSMVGDSVISMPFYQEMEVKNISLQMEEATLNWNAPVAFSEVGITLLDNSRLALYEEHTWDACEIFIGKDSGYLSEYSDITFSNQCKLTNEGTLSVYAWPESWVLFGDTRIENDGDMHIYCNCAIDDEQLLYNEGELELPFFH